jgi:hypothetical protein
MMPMVAVATRVVEAMVAVVVVEIELLVVYGNKKPRKLLTCGAGEVLYSLTPCSTALPSRNRAA